MATHSLASARLGSPIQREDLIALLAAAPERERTAWTFAQGGAGPQPVRVDVDLGALRRVRVDAARAMARVEGGATWCAAEADARRAGLSLSRLEGEWASWSVGGALRDGALDDHPAGGERPGLPLEADVIAGGRIQRWRRPTLTALRECQAILACAFALQPASWQPAATTLATSDADTALRLLQACVDAAEPDLQATMWHSSLADMASRWAAPLWSRARARFEAATGAAPPTTAPPWRLRLAVVDRPGLAQARLQGLLTRLASARLGTWRSLPTSEAPPQWLGLRATRAAMVQTLGGGREHVEWLGWDAIAWWLQACGTAPPGGGWRRVRRVWGLDQPRALGARLRCWTDDMSADSASLTSPPTVLRGVPGQGRALRWDDASHTVGSPPDVRWGAIFELAQRHGRRPALALPASTPVTVGALLSSTVQAHAWLARTAIARPERAIFEALAALGTQSRAGTSLPSMESPARLRCRLERAGLVAGEEAGAVTPWYARWRTSDARCVRWTWQADATTIVQSRAALTEASAHVERIGVTRQSDALLLWVEAAAEPPAVRAAMDRLRAVFPGLSPTEQDWPVDALADAEVAPCDLADGLEDAGIAWVAFACDGALALRAPKLQRRSRGGRA